MDTKDLYYKARMSEFLSMIRTLALKPASGVLLRPVAGLASRLCRKVCGVKRLSAARPLASGALAALLLSSVLVAPAQAVIEIEITQGGENAIPIAIVPFGWSGTGEVPEDVAAIVDADLHRSGNFAPLNRDDLVAKPVSGDVPRYANWRLSGADFLLIGGIRPAGDGYVVEFQLYDVLQQSLMTGFNFQVTDQTLRSAAHQISDEVYEEILGIPGAFNTQISFVSVSGSVGDGDRRYLLQLADADGENPQTMLDSPRPILSPAWAPDGIRIAYVSFENRTQSAIYIQDREKGSRIKMPPRTGINGAPSWSPDGERLAVTLSFEGNADIYVLQIDSGEFRRVTDSDAIDTEAVWRDDETLIFTSDRSGGPQLYEVSARGGRANRITFEGKYNASATVSPDGSSVAFVHGAGAGFQIGLLDRASGLFQTLTQGTLDESPSFSPNGQMIIYATEKNGRGTLGAVSLDGSVVQSLSLNDGGSVREPAWSPYSK
ncbi:Tol-Pal system beta propeller repeat protein TolB [Granulosicoccus antarcticus]|uniref:Tol-Pal system beta propeller repeat protein TolB n=1 Tax=Granulosicoccus antarcticus TaxID=437505 RepID=UPI001F01DCD8|nr:Tol-Pal system beta propeller repeat protein TolB [Granulosicoccus antarcticus]